MENVQDGWRISRESGRVEHLVANANHWFGTYREALLFTLYMFLVDSMAYLLLITLISQQYRAEYYKRDVQAEVLPDSTLDAAVLENPENMSEAYRVLHGHVLREEVYSLDQEQTPGLAEHPYASDWELKMPEDSNSIDLMNSISDVIIHLRYTALDGYGLFKDKDN